MEIVWAKALAGSNPVPTAMTERLPVETEETAYIESVVTDMGNGASWCGTCGTEVNIDEHLRILTKELDKILHGKKLEPRESFRCKNPDCNRILIDGGPPIVPNGGSDF